MMISNLNLAKLPECVCEMRYIDSALLTPCAEYQRVLRTRKVEEISATFSEYVANEPRVSYRDGRYHVFDGQNTIEARIACNGGHDLPILCKVFHGLSKKDEALLFAVQTGISTDLTAGERLRADIVAEDEDACAFVAATEATGATFALDGIRAEWKIYCIRSAYYIYKHYGSDIYQEALKIIVEAWWGDSDSFLSGILHGVTRFVAMYRDEYSRERLIARLSTVHPQNHHQKCTEGHGQHRRPPYEADSGNLQWLQPFSEPSCKTLMLSPLSAYSFFPARAACQNRAALATYRRIGGLIAIIPKDWKYLRGDIYYADMEPHIGSEQGGTRPVVVLQNDVGNRYAPTLIVATVTSRTEKKRYQPTHVLIAHNTAFEKPSVVQLEQIFTIDKSRIQRFLGQTTRNEMRRIEEALMNSLEINEWDRRNADE